MNSQRSPHTLSNSALDRPLSTISQIQNSSMINIKPLAYPCRYHPDEICLNYCIEQKCFQALCSQCIEEHLLHHKKTGLNDLYVKSFKSVRSECSSKLIKIIDKLLAKLGILNQPKNPQEMFQDSDRQLENIRLLMHEIIDQEFNKIRQTIKHKVSENFMVVKQLTEIHENLIKIINQLKEHNAIISQGILDHPVNVGDSIEKTLLLNESALLQMFEKQSMKYDQKFRNINVEILFSESEFRQATLSCLRIGASNSSNVFNKNSNISRVSHFGNRIDDTGSDLRSRSRSPINDRSLDMKKGGQANVNYPILHFFQTGQNMLHLIDLKGQPQRSAVQLGNFRVPTFHASLLSQKTGSIFISGGNIELTQASTKSSTMSKFSLISNEFKKEFAQVRARSSHTLCEDFYSDCIYILGGYGESTESDHDESIATFETTVERVNLKNGSVQEVSQSNWGGACIAVMSGTFIIKACMEGIEVYDSSNNIWSSLSKVKSVNIDGVFCRGAGYSLLGPTSVLIYGGYDESQQSRKECYVMNINLNNQSPGNSSAEVQRINSNLPIAEGFWNNPGILYQNYVWAVQNVEDADGEAVESQRTLLRLDIESKKWSVIKMLNKFRKN